MYVISISTILRFFSGRKPPSRSSRLLLPDWSQEDVQAWLHEEGLVDQLAAVFRGNNVDGAKLAQLSEATALEMGIGEWESAVSVRSTRTPRRTEMAGMKSL